MPACTFFGHRDAPPQLREPLLRTVEELVCREDVTQFYVGHQGAFDALAAGVLRELSQRLPIRFAVVLAYPPREEADWRTHLFPEGIELVPPRFAIDWRHRWMLAHSDCVVTYVCRSGGGAARYAALARRQGKRVIALSPPASPPAAPPRD